MLHAQAHDQPCEHIYVFAAFANAKTRAADEHNDLLYTYLSVAAVKHNATNSSAPSFANVSF